MTNRRSMLVPLLFMKCALLTAEKFNCTEQGEWLNLARRNIIKAPVWEGSCHLVKKIDLSGNNIRDIGEGYFGRFESLKILYFNYSGLEHLSEKAFGKTTSLEELYLQENKLSEFPMKLIQHLLNLRILSIHSNLFLQIRGLNRSNAKFKILLLGPQLKMNRTKMDFNRLKYLEVLNVTKINITKVPSFPKDCRIKHLDLSRNSLTLYVNDFDDCIHLETVNFKACSVEILDNDVFKNHRNLTKLDLTENPLKNHSPTNNNVIFRLVHARVLVEVNCLICLHQCINTYPNLKMLCSAHEKEYKWCPPACRSNTFNVIDENKEHLGPNIIPNRIPFTQIIMYTMMTIFIIFVISFTFCMMKCSRRVEILRPEGSSHLTNITDT